MSRPMLRPMHTMRFDDQNKLKDADKADLKTLQDGLAVLAKYGITEVTEVKELTSLVSDMVSGVFHEKQKEIPTEGSLDSTLEQIIANDAENKTQTFYFVKAERLRNSKQRLQKSEIKEKSHKGDHVLCVDSTEPWQVGDTLTLDTQYGHEQHTIKDIEGTERIHLQEELKSDVDEGETVQGECGLPRFQELLQLDGGEWVEVKTFPTKDLIRGRFKDELIATSHRWEDANNPDPDGTQCSVIQQFLKDDTKGKQAKLVWYDFWCAPQGRDRTPAEKKYFLSVLKAIDMLYLGATVLILADLSYQSRFWTLFESWLSMQSCSDEGLTPERKHSRVHIKCLHGATDDKEGQKLKDMWSTKKLDEACEVLKARDVVVTNMSDKRMKLKRFSELERWITSAFDPKDAAEIFKMGMQEGNLKQDVKDLLEMGFTEKCLIQAIADLKECGFWAAGLKEVGFTAGQLLRYEPIDQEEAQEHRQAILSAGFTEQELQFAGFSRKEMQGVGFHFDEENDGDDCFVAGLKDEKLFFIDGTWDETCDRIGECCKILMTDPSNPDKHWKVKLEDESTVWFKKDEIIHCKELPAQVQKFLKGEKVYIFSNSAHKWFAGQIEKVFHMDCTFEEHDIKAGTLKVTFDSNKKKYVVPEGVVSFLRKASYHPPPDSKMPDPVIVESHEKLGKVYSAESIVAAWYGKVGDEWERNGMYVTEEVKDLIRSCKDVCADSAGLGVSDPCQGEPKRLIVIVQAGNDEASPSTCSVTATEAESPATGGRISNMLGALARKFSYEKEPTLSSLGSFGGNNESSFRSNDHIRETMTTQTTTETDECYVVFEETGTGS